MRVDLEMGGANNVILDDLEGLLRDIQEFCASNNCKMDEMPKVVENYLGYVADCGNTIYPWHHVRLLFRNKILHAMEQFPGEMFPNSEAFIMERFDLFRAAPFTIQRLAELITQPTRHYKQKEKFLRGLEKTVLVVSTVEPWSIEAERNGNDSGSDEETAQQHYDGGLSHQYGMDRGVGESDSLQSHGDLLLTVQVQAQQHLASVSNNLHGSVVDGDTLMISSDENINSLRQAEAVVENVTTTMVTLISESGPSLTANSLTETVTPMVLVEEMSAEQSAIVVEENKEKYTRELDNTVLVVSSIDSNTESQLSRLYSTDANESTINEAAAAIIQNPEIMQLERLDANVEVETVVEDVDPSAMTTEKISDAAAAEIENERAAESSNLELAAPENQVLSSEAVSQFVSGECYTENSQPSDLPNGTNMQEQETLLDKEKESANFVEAEENKSDDTKDTSSTNPDITDQDPNQIVSESVTQ